jgi:hypothetical protein
MKQQSVKISVQPELRERIVEAIESGAAKAWLGEDFREAAQQALWERRLFIEERHVVFEDIVQAVKMVTLLKMSPYVAWVKVRGRKGRPW